jgi:hypothetical protein
VAGLLVASSSSILAAGTQQKKKKVLSLCAPVGVVLQWLYCWSNV